MNINRYFLDSHFQHDKCIGVAGVTALFNTLTSGIANAVNNDGDGISFEEVLNDKKWMRSMYDLQRADNLSDWNMENEYNSPANQRKLLEEAGYNPALFGDQIAGSSQASSVKEASYASPTSTRSFSATNTDSSSIFNGIVNGAANIMNAITNSRAQSSTESYQQGQLELLGNSTNQNISESIQRIANMKLQGNLYGEQVRNLKIENQFKGEVMKAQIDQVRTATAYTQTQIDAQTYLNTRLPEKTNLELANLSAQYDKIIDDMKTNAVSRKLANAQIGALTAQAKMLLMQATSISDANNRANALQPSQLAASEAHSQNIQLGRSDDWSTRERLAPVSMSFGAKGLTFGANGSITLPAKGMMLDGKMWLKQCMQEMSQYNNSIPSYNKYTPY